MANHRAALRSNPRAVIVAFERSMEMEKQAERRERIHQKMTS
jgi:hypothetical protein